MGQVGAALEFFPASDQGILGFAPLAPEGGAYAAAEVKGDSGWPVYRDGDLVYFDVWRDDVDTFINEDVIAQLADGRMLLKTLGPRTGQTFTLTSFNAPPLTMVEIVRVARVLWIRRGKPTAR